MYLESKMFIYWVILVTVFYIVAKIDHLFNGGNIYFKYYDSWTVAFYLVSLYAGLFAICVFVFVEFTTYFFTGEFVPLTPIP